MRLFSFFILKYSDQKNIIFLVINLLQMCDTCNEVNVYPDRLERGDGVVTVLSMFNNA